MKIFTVEYLMMVYSQMSAKLVKVAGVNKL